MFLYSIQGQFNGCHFLNAALKSTIFFNCFSSVGTKSHFCTKNERLSDMWKRVLKCETEIVVTVLNLYIVLWDSKWLLKIGGTPFKCISNISVTNTWRYRMRIGKDPSNYLDKFEMLR